MLGAAPGGAEGRFPVLSRSILALRVALLSLALLAVAVAFRGAGTAPSQGLLYSCPMHPEVRSERASDCPVCGMALQALQPEALAPAPENLADSPASRSYVKPAVQHVFSQAIEAPAWLDEQGLVQALFYNDELAALTEQRQPSARFGLGGPLLALSLTPEPPVAWDEATSRVTFQFRGPGGARPRPKSVGRVLLPAARRASLVVPDDALLELDDGPYVLVRGADSGGFEKRPLRIGKTQYDMVTVVSGLSGHEPVVVRNTFLLDAERRFRADLGSMP
jgi:hypothetical protein